MRWRYEQRSDGMLTNGIPLIRHTLINDNGVSIWAGPSFDGWLFCYTQNGDEIRFNVRRENHEYVINEPLSGACLLTIVESKSRRRFKLLSRGLKEQIVAVVIDCITHADLLPSMEGNHAERVSLDSSMQNLFDGEDTK
jgi:hypothetical protein